MSDSLFKSFYKDQCPEWLCPACMKPSLAIVKDSFNGGYSAWTQRYWTEIDPEQHESVFSCLLRCTRSDCGETVVVSGEEEIFQGSGDTESGYSDTVYHHVFNARSFMPPVPLFVPPDQTPDIVIGQLREISSLLTGHPAAAANAIRSLLETLLDDLNVPRMEQRQGKTPRPIKLHDRLELHKNMPGSHYDGMMALKMFGNAGSHGGTPIEQQHLEDACIVLEQLVIQLYQSKPDLSLRIKRLSQAFNKK